MISEQYSTFRLLTLASVQEVFEMLLAFYDTLDPHKWTSYPVEEPGNIPIDVEPLTDKGSEDGDPDTASTRKAHGGRVERELEVVDYSRHAQRVM